MPHVECDMLHCVHPVRNTRRLGLDKAFYTEVIHASRAVLAAKTIVSHIQEKSKGVLITFDSLLLESVSIIVVFITEKRSSSRKGSDSSMFVQFCENCHL